MPSVAWTLQRELADSFIRCAPLDDIRILLACGAKVNEPVTSQGLRPLHYAAFQQYLEALQLLLVRGSDPDAMDEIGYTAMHLCAERGYLDLVQLLIEHKAKVCFTDVSATQQALGNPPRAVLADEPLRLAIKNGHYEVAEVLLQNGADPNARYFLGAEINLVNPLDTRFLELLVRYGADPDSRDRTGLTPLMKACRHPRALAAAKLLIRYGADVRAVASDRHDNRTPLHYAVLSGNMETVKMLLDKGPASAGHPEMRAQAQKCGTRCSMPQRHARNQQVPPPDRQAAGRPHAPAPEASRPPLPQESPGQAPAHNPVRAPLTHPEDSPGLPALRPLIKDTRTFIPLYSHSYFQLSQVELRLFLLL